MRALLFSTGPGTEQTGPLRAEKVRQCGGGKVRQRLPGNARKITRETRRWKSAAFPPVGQIRNFPAGE
jgi:hypothetical protein